MNNRLTSISILHIRPKRLLSLAIRQLIVISILMIIIFQYIPNVKAGVITVDHDVGNVDIIELSGHGRIINPIMWGGINQTIVDPSSGNSFIGLVIDQDNYDHTPGAENISDSYESWPYIFEDDFTGTSSIVMIYDDGTTQISSASFENTGAGTGDPNDILINQTAWTVLNEDWAIIQWKLINLKGVDITGVSIGLELPLSQYNASQGVDSGVGGDGGDDIDGYDPVNETYWVQDDDGTTIGFGSANISDPITHYYSEEYLNYTDEYDNDTWLYNRLKAPNSVVGSTPGNRSSTVGWDGFTIPVGSFRTVTLAIAVNNSFNNMTTALEEARSYYTNTIIPSSNISVGAPKYGSSPTYVTSATEFSLTATSNPGSGIESIWYKIDSGSWEIYTGAFTVSGYSEGSHIINYYSIDNSGQTEPMKSLDVYLDDMPPMSSLSIGNPRNGTSPTYVNPITPFNLSAIDFGSGVEFILTSNDDVTYYAYTGNFTFTTTGSQTLYYCSIDHLGNNESSTPIDIFVDATTPNIQLLTPVNNSVIAPGAVLDFQVSDDYLSFVNYSIDGGSVYPLSDPFDIDTTGWAEGSHTVLIEAKDDVENSNSSWYMFTIDTTAPTINFDAPGNNSTALPGTQLYFTIFDPNLMEVNYSIDGGPVTPLLDPYDISTNGWSEGEYTIQINAADLVGNSNSSIFTITISDATVDSIDIVDTEGTGSSSIDGQLIDVGATIRGYAAAWNNTHGYIGDVSVNWSVINSNGATATTSPQNDSFSDFFSGGLDGSATWTAEYGLGMTDSIIFTIRDLTPPVVDPGSDATINEDTPYMFDGSGSWDNSGSIAWYNWSFGDGETDYGTNPTPFHTYTSNGVYIVTLNVSDAAGNWNFTSITITVSASTVDYIVIMDEEGGAGSVVGIRTYIVGDTDIFYAAGFNYTTGYVEDIEVSWSSSDYTNVTVGLGPSTSTILSANSSQGGIVTISATNVSLPEPSNSTGILTFLSPTEIDYIDIVDTSGTGSSTIDNQFIDVNVTLRGYAAAWNNTNGYLGDIQVTWSVINSNGATASTSLLSDNYSDFYSGLTEGTATWTVESGFYTDSVEFTIRDLTIPVVNAGSDATINEDTPYMFDGSGSWDNSGSIAWYNWSFGDGNKSSSSDPTTSYSYADPGYYTVLLDVSDPSGNWNIDIIYITVYDATPPNTILTIGEPKYRDDSTHEWNVTSVTPLTLSAQDEGMNSSGCNFTWYTIDGDYYVYTGSFDFSSYAEGMHTLTYGSEDLVGNNHTGTQLTVTVVPSGEDGTDTSSDSNILILLLAVIAISIIIIVAFLVIKQKRDQAKAHKEIESEISELETEIEKMKEKGIKTDELEKTLEEMKAQIDGEMD